MLPWGQRRTTHYTRLRMQHQVQVIFQILVQQLHQREHCFIRLVQIIS